MSDSPSPLRPNSDAEVSGMTVMHFHDSPFTFDNLLLLEECPYRCAQEVRDDLPEGSLLLVASASRQQLASILDDDRYTIAHLAHPPAYHPSRSMLVGFLAAEKIRLATTTHYQSKLLYMGSSLLEDQEAVDGVLIQRWQQECRAQTWLELCADIGRHQQDDPLFARLGFQRVRQRQSTTKDSLIWRPGQVLSW